MLDRLRLFVPFRPEHIAGGAGYCTTELARADGLKGYVDLCKLGVPLDGAISILPDGTRQIESLRHPWELVPSSYSPMAFKIHNNGHHYPGIEIKASPAKLMQGHNVFGPTSIGDGGAEMLAMLSAAYPALFDCLEPRLTEVWELDCTYSARMPNEHTALAVLRFLKNVSRGHRKARGDGFDTTTYWGNKDSRYSSLKAYLKSPEYLAQLAEYQRRSKSGDTSAARVVEVMESPRLIEWARNLIRWEATIKKRYLERREIPHLWVDLAKYQKQQAADGVCILQQFWGDITGPVFSAFEGATMKIIDDDKVLKALKAQFVRTTKSGKQSYSYALNLFRTFRDIREYGWEVTSASMSRSSFYRHISEIAQCGVSVAQLQNMQAEHRSNNVVPLLRFVHVDFSAQLPEWYQPPVSQFKAASAA